MSGEHTARCWGAVRELRWDECLSPLGAAGSPVGHSGAGEFLVGQVRGAQCHVCATCGPRSAPSRAGPGGQGHVATSQVAGPHPAACSPRQVDPRSYSSTPGELPEVVGWFWRAWPGGRGCCPRSGWEALGPTEGGRAGRWRGLVQLCPEEHGVGTRKRPRVLSPPPPCPQKMRLSEQRPPGESGPSLWASVTEPACLAADSWRLRTCHYHGPGALGRDT